MTPPRWLRRIVRNFPENGLKVLLSNAANLQDVLQLLRVKLRTLLDFSQLHVEPTRFIHRNYRHLEADLVLTVPLRDRSGPPILIYILIEHQTEPDPFMAFRVLEYVVLIYRRQMQTWEREHGSLDGFKFQPVLPIVLYSGTRTWDDIDPLRELMELSVEAATELRAVAPSLKPLFLNVSSVGDDELTRQGGVFGWILRLLERRKMRPEIFEAALERVLQNLEGLSEVDRQRWRELLAYLQALVYNERPGIEHEPLRTKIQEQFSRAEDQREVRSMEKTIWQTIMDQGRAEGEQREALRSRKQMLERMLRKKFRRVPARVVKRIEAETRVGQLDAWLDEFATTDTLEAMSVAQSE